MRNSLFAIYLLGGLLGVISSAAAQDEKATSFDRLIVNSDGTISYFEPLDATLVNRIEFRNRVRPLMEIYTLLKEGEKKIQIIDYNNDLHPDFIRIERATDEKIVETVSFYRGPLHKQHEESHLEHALGHSFVRRDSVLAREMRDKLEAMRQRHIPDTEIGVFSGYSLFAELKLKVIESAFTACDSLFQGIGRVTTLDISSLRDTPYLGSRYRGQIKLLVGINPHTLGIVPENSTIK